VNRHVVARADEIAPGTCKIVTAGGREIGIFNLGGEYFALANRCPHAGGPLCRGRIVGLISSEGPNRYRVSRPGEFIRCPWHGWEYDIRTGQSWCDPKSVVARHFEVTVEPGAELAKGPYVAESFPVEVEADYLVIDLAGPLGREEPRRN
jgi:nitrite reductase/ring-hydroxylating ferredoxin subunit